MANDVSIGVLNEVGDMGLGWRPLSEPDNKIVNEANKKDAPETTVINEEKK